MGVPENVVFIANIAMIVDKPWTTSDSFWMFFFGPAFSDNYRVAKNAFVKHGRPLAFGGQSHSHLSILLRMWVVRCLLQPPFVQPR
jgi:hypothetical protein